MGATPKRFDSSILRQAPIAQRIEYGPPKAVMVVRFHLGAPMKREFSAGGVVFKKNLWLIIKHRPSSDFPQEQWRLPKGNIDPGEKITDTAIREVLEETGINAKILGKVSDQRYVYTFRGEKIFKIVTFYLMEYLSGEPKENDEVEEIFWLPLEKAKKTLSFQSDKSILQKAKELLEATNRPG